MSFPFGDAKIAEQISHMEEMPSREATYGQITRPKHPVLEDQLKGLGIERLYSHQALAYDAVMDGRDVVVTTGTNSGKTMCYNLPALQLCLSEPVCRCLYLFPTKALAQDQLGKLTTLLPPSVRAGTYDGDTPQSHRSGLRKQAHIILTNPDMLHIGVLPGHEHWARFLKSLRLIVIDEMHVYRGVFGSNVCGVLRRLLRLCEWHHSRPQIVACSATISNPTELFQNLTGRKPLLIDQDGSPNGKRTFVFYNPPEIGTGQRLSANVATSDILSALVAIDQRTIAFSRARVSAELVLRYARKRAKEDAIVAPTAIESYRAGYGAKERRQIEKGLFQGKILGLSSTNAMELGVDVGGLDAVIMNGYPGTTSSFWQQAGRAGRGTRDGLAVFIAHNDPLEQFLVREPEMLLNSRNESVCVNPQNPTILGQQLLCAAHERPIAVSELESFGKDALNIAEGLDRSGALQFRTGLFFYPSIEPPAPKVNIRGAGGEIVRLLLDGQELGTMEMGRAITSAHEGAIYLHRGESYIVTVLDLNAKQATVVAFDADYYTQALVQSLIDPKGEIRRQGRISQLGVTVTEIVDGFRKKSLDGDTVLGVEPLELPPQTYETIAIRIDLPALDMEKDLNAQVGAMHGLEHALLAVAPLLAGCDRGDLGSAWYSMFPDTMSGAVFIFDKTPGGVGLCDELFKQLSGWFQSALALLTSCECETGCPACLMSPRCEAGNENLDKKATVRLLKAFLLDPS